MKFFTRIKSKLQHNNSRLVQEDDSETVLPEDFPLPSLEAYTLLKRRQQDITITNFIVHFTNFPLDETLDLKKSVNTKDFILDFSLTSGRLLYALDNEKPYPTLLSDLIRFQEQLQVIMRYYQTEIENGQTVANSFLRQSKNHNSSVNILLNKSSKGLKPELNDNEANLIKQIIYASNADRLMKEQLHLLEEFILAPYLMDHSDEPNFSYLK